MFHVQSIKVSLLHDLISSVCLCKAQSLINNVVVSFVGICLAKLFGRKIKYFNSHKNLFVLFSPLYSAVIIASNINKILLLVIYEIET